MGLPLFLVIGFAGIDTGTTVLVYGVGLLLDLIAGIVLLWVAARYYNRTARGELFRIPLVTSISDRVFRIEPE